MMYTLYKSSFTAPSAKLLLQFSKSSEDLSLTYHLFSLENIQIINRPLKKEMIILKIQPSIHLIRLKKSL